jgi:hypothetical protein
VSVSGTYDVAISTPMGEQRGTAAFAADGGSFSGRFESPLGAVDIRDGRVDGNRLTWGMEISSPMKLQLDCTATIDGDTLAGTVKAGLFGTMALRGTRRS